MVLHKQVLKTCVVLLSVARLRFSVALDLPYGQVTGSSWDVAQFLQDYERNASEMCFRVTSATWGFSTNVTEINRKRMLEEQDLAIKLGKEWWRRASGLSATPADVSTKRQFRILLTEGRFALDDERFRELYGLIARMKDTFSLKRVCPSEHRRVSVPCPWRLEPELVRIMGGRWDEDILRSAWVAWHDEVGPPLRPYFVRYVQLANEAARLSGFADAGAHMRAPYGGNGGGGGGNPPDSPSLSSTAGVDGPPLEPADVAALWSQVAPLYRQLHAFVRRGLIAHYGSNIIQEGGPIPAHLLGNMWAQSWRNIADLVAPFPSKTAADVTPEMLRQGYTPLRIFQTAEEFFTSMGLPEMPATFWQNSMLQRPQDREVVCRASAWDFCNGHDYRIKHCTEVTMDDLLTAHHEMAHVQYYLHYKKQPFLFRRGANPGFHEAIGDAIGLSASTPRHLQRIGLLNNITDDYETNINFLMTVALDKVVYLAFAYVVEQWRWKVFTEGVDSMNERWWRLRWLHHGIAPPVPRTEDHLDAAAKYHVAADAPYLRYFIALILQFQIHEALCQAAGHRGPLHTCDIYRSKEAGLLLRDVLSLGASFSWRDAVRVATKGAAHKLDARPLLEYFQPLELWLRVQNRGRGTVGWTDPENTELVYFHHFLKTKKNSKGSSAEAKSGTILLVTCAFWILNRP